MEDASVSDTNPNPKPAYETSGDRLRFTVEIRPGETTIVSWKKLLKEAAAAASSSKRNTSAPLPPQKEGGDDLESGIPPEKEQGEGGDDGGQAQPNRLSTVIERIERMYAGNGSSGEEDVFLNDVPDDDEYDTDDSFIDDAELDDYFQVDNSAIKHDGFFVNRGKLERIEPTVSTTQPPKKRRRKDVTKGSAGDDDEQNPSKHVKLGNKGRKPSTERYSITPSRNADVLSASSPTNAAEISARKKAVDTKITVDPSGLLSGGGTGTDRDTDQQKTGASSSKNHSSKQKERNEHQVTPSQRSNDKSSGVSKSHSGKQRSNSDDPDHTIQRKEKGGLVERFDLNVPASRESVQIAKVPLVSRKEGSNVRPKSSALDKAIRELEKIVAQSRPPSAEVQDPDNSSQAVKRRLTPEIKQKMGKVARLAQTSYGKIPKDVINRLMSIVGHLMQLRSLKRNLKIMASMGLSARQEKDDRLQKIKEEVAELVAQRIPYIKSKVEQQTTNSDDFQEAAPEEKEALKRKYSMDDALENKICDMYDLYVERLEEDSGPPVRRLYEELAALWPSEFMDTDGIKRAISKAKDRRRALCNRRKDQEKIRKKKALAPKTENTTEGEALSVPKSLHTDEKLSEPPKHKPALSSQAVVSANIPKVDKPKQDIVTGSSSGNPIDGAPTDVSLLAKKKVKSKQKAVAAESQFCLEKVVADKNKHPKQVEDPLPKSTTLLDATAPSGSENPS